MSIPLTIICLLLYQVENVIVTIIFVGVKKRFHLALIISAITAGLMAISNVELAGKAQSVSSSTIGKILDYVSVAVDESTTESSKKTSEPKEDFTFNFPNIFDIFRSIF